MARQWGKYVDSVGEFTTDVAFLSFGAAASQLILLAGSPILTRLYSASEFAEFALFLAAANLLGQTACLKYDLAVVVAEKSEHARRLFVLCLAASAASAALLTAILPFSAAIARILRAENRGWLFFLPASALLMGVHAALSAMALRRKMLMALTASAFLRSSVQLVLQMLLALVFSGGPALCASYLVSYAAACALLLYRLRGQDLFMFADFAKLRITAKEGRQYPSCVMPGALANTMVYSLSNFVLSARASSAVLGWYMMVNRLLSAPLTVLTGPVGQLFLRGFSRRPAEERARMFVAVSAGMLLIGAASGAVLWMASGFLPLLLGGGWEGTAPILRIMLPLYVARFAVSPVSCSAIVAGKQRATMIWQLGMLTLSAVSAAAAIRMVLTAQNYLAVFGALLTVGYLAFWVYCLCILRGGGRR